MNHPTECANLEASCYRALKELMGSTHDGSETTVTLTEDDATRDYIVSVGNKQYWASTLEMAIYEAYQQTTED